MTHIPQNYPPDPEGVHRAAGWTAFWNLLNETRVNTRWTTPPCMVLNEVQAKAEEWQRAGWSAPRDMDSMEWGFAVGWDDGTRCLFGMADTSPERMRLAVPIWVMPEHYEDR